MKYQTAPAANLIKKVNLKKTFLKKILKDCKLVVLVTVSLWCWLSFNPFTAMIVFENDTSVSKF